MLENMAYVMLGYIIGRMIRRFIRDFIQGFRSTYVPGSFSKAFFDAADVKLNR